MKKPHFNSKYHNILTKQFLIKEYIINKKTIKQIAKKVGCSNTAIYYNLKKYNISVRTNSEAKLLQECKYSKILTKEFLYKEYIVNKKSMGQIAKEVECGDGTVFRYFIIHKIQTRTLNEALKGKANYFYGKSGKRSPSYKHGETLKKHYCIDCGDKICYNTWKDGNKRCLICHSKFCNGINHPNYIKDLIREYPFAFNSILKESIRARDNNICQICGKTTKKNGRNLDVHHIDYDKNNLNPKNLISLCMACHMKSNYNREIYIEYFKILLNVLSKEV